MRIIRYCEVCGKSYGSKHQAKATDMARRCCAEQKTSVLKPAQAPVLQANPVVPIELPTLPPLTTREEARSMEDEEPRG